MSSTILISFVIPTRGRPESLVRVCESIRATTAHPDQLEIVLVMDDDDRASLAFEFGGLRIRKEIGPPGRSMGELNMAGYRATTGQYIMLMNDDVVLQTPNWDDRVLEVFNRYSDGIVLVHVNELIFKEKLCTFPFLPRTFCEMAGGICPEGYRRYRIDDHIHNVFDLLALLGKRRRIFLPDVIFGHENFVETEEGHQYQPNPDVHAVDTQLFDSLLPERKRLAMACMDAIGQRTKSDQGRLWEALLRRVTDSVAIRDPRHARVQVAASEGAAPARVTIGVVSADIRCEHARKCLELIKTHTRDYDLLIVDNNGSSDFNHAREMNRLLEACRTEYLILMDDDVFVGEGWLEGMMRAMAPGVGVVTPVHYDRDGNFSYAGVVMQPDESGHHTHVVEIGGQPRHIETLCSAVMLIDLPSCGHVRLSEVFTKYFLDIDYGLRIWEEGYRVVCSPWSKVTHIGGGTMTQGGERSVQLFEEQRQHYLRDWVDTGRIHALRQGTWRSIPEFQEIAQLKREIDGLFVDGSCMSRQAFYSRIRTLNTALNTFPAFRRYLADRTRLALGGRIGRVDDPDLGHVALLLTLADVPVLYEVFDGMSIVLWRDQYWALPAAEGVFDAEKVHRREYSVSYKAADLEQIKAMIRTGAASNTRGGQTPVRIATAAGNGAAVIGTANGRHSTPGRTTALKRLARAAPFARVLRPLKHNLFDPDYYRGTYPDVAEAGTNPLLHFITAGASEGRNPCQLFDTLFYLRKYPDVAASGANPLGHYLKFGAREGRQPHPLFDPQYYLRQYPDVFKSGINPLVHYYLNGAAEGRRPHAWFDPAYYLSRLPEPPPEGTNPLAHFLRSGPPWLDPHPQFDCGFYVTQNPDLSVTRLNPLVHFVLYGAVAGRRTRP